jgi:GR25 family glycosyltransferase involved in LPS biosynthesis
VQPKKEIGMERGSLFGSFFDRVIVINLDRRPDRMSRVAAQLEALGIQYVRQPAIDGNQPAVKAEWLQYLQAAAQPPDLQRQVRDWRDFYLGDRPHSSRVAFFEANRGPRAISTAGAWGLYLSMREAIGAALSDNVERLLILEDDVVFHRDTIDLWPIAKSELPDDWQILQLGAMQTHWEENWITWHSQHLYMCNGSSFAAHAIGLRRQAMAAIMNRARAPDLPFDIGPLTEAKRLFSNKCYTVYPNIAIQEGRDTDIGMSMIFDQERQKQDNVYRWTWTDYGSSVLRPVPNRAVKAKSDTSAAGPAFLQPYGKTPGAAERVIVVFGPKSDLEAERYVKMLGSLKAAGEVAPIVLIDDLAHIQALRKSELAFEYIAKPEGLAASLPAGRNVDLVIARRLAILRRKWLPRRIMALGDGAKERLALWRASPFEQAEFGADLAVDFDQSEPVAAGPTA